MIYLFGNTLTNSLIKTTIDIDELAAVKLGKLIDCRTWDLIFILTPFTLYVTLSAHTYCYSGEYY